MKKKDKILFIGPINKGRDVVGGADAKNRFILKKLEEQYGKVKCVDAIKKGLPTILKIVLGICFHNRIVVSGSTPGVTKLSKLNIILKRKRVTVFIIGGFVYKKFNNNSLQRFYENANIVYAETEGLKKAIEQKSSKVNVSILPNFRVMHTLRVARENNPKIVRLVYMSRVNEEKGIFRCLNLVNELNKKDNNRYYQLDIYGRMELSEQAEKSFYKQIEASDTFCYKRFLDLNKPLGYKVLSQYHFFLFLTNHEGEGFPGVMLDALIAGVPMIASDWKFNKEVLPKGGFLVGLNNAGYQAEILTYMNTINQKDKTAYQQFIGDYQAQGKKYDIDNVTFKVA